MAFAPDDMPKFHPQTVLLDWGNGRAFRLADAQTGACVFGTTGSGKTSGPAIIQAALFKLDNPSNAVHKLQL